MKITNSNNPVDQSQKIASDIVVPSVSSSVKNNPSIHSVEEKNKSHENDNLQESSSDNHIEKIKTKLELNISSVVSKVLKQEFIPTNLKKSNEFESSSEKELAKLYMDRGDFHIAIPKIETLLVVYLQKKDFASVLDCSNDLIKMYTELQQFQKIEWIKNQLNSLVTQGFGELMSFAYFTFGVCEACQKNYEKAQFYFQSALDVALKSNDKKSMSYAVGGLAYTYTRLGKISEAMQEIYNLKIFLEILPLRDLQISAEIFHGSILRKIHKYNEALDVFWKCYDLLKHDKNHFMSMQLLYNIGLTYKCMGDENSARTYLLLLRRSIDCKNFVRLCRDVDSQLQELGCSREEIFDLIYDSTKNKIVEKDLGEIEIHNQQIVLDLLRLFMKSPGVIYSKKDLVQRIWNESYSPHIHDNKIYVSIKRLRNLIEPDIKNPKYVFRDKQGYFLKTGLKIKII